MDVTVTSAFCFLLLILPQISLQQTCSPPTRVDITENNKVGDTVAEIPLGTDVTLELKSNPQNSFTLEGNLLKAAVVFDFETWTPFNVEITCIPPVGRREDHEIIIIVLDVNDNRPFFEKTLYEVEINELSPPNTLVGTFSADDADKNTKLYYRLTPESVGFSLEAVGIRDAKIVTTESFDYSKNKSFELQLYVQDTPLGSTITPSHNNETTINVTILDIDNRPPWFQPCSEIEISGTTVCVADQSYTGSIYLNEQQTGALTLKPNPILAVDGDSGRNEKIVYSIVSGNEDGAFKIDSSTGSITMLKPITTLGTITLTVLAAQEVNVHQVATTSVSIAVLTRSSHRPQFPSALYEGIVTEVGMMAKNKNDMDQLLRIIATDEDYGEVENPNIAYSIDENNDFSLNKGYLFMTTRVADGTYSLTVRAVDSSNEESATTKVSVEVKSGPTVPPSTSTTGSETPEVTISSAVPSLSTGTTISGATTTVSQPTPGTGPTESTSISSESTLPETTVTGVTPGNNTPSGSTSASTPAETTQPVETTVTGVTPGNTTPSSSTSMDTSGTASGPSPSTTADGTATSSLSSPVATPSPNPTGDGTVSTVSTQPPTGEAPGGFDTTDMAALGATLGILLLLALVIMMILIFRLRREKKDWKKIYESNMFRSSLGEKSGGAKEGIQYSNKAFDNDEDDDNRGSGSPVNGVVLSTLTDVGDYSKYESIVEPKLPPQGDDSSQSGSEKEVKPILTKGRRVEEGYKSVWFKEDIDPNAKEEVVIIPDSRENGSDDDDSSSDKESGDESPQRRSRVLFSDFANDKGVEVLSIDL